MNKYALNWIVNGRYKWVVLAVKHGRLPGRCDENHTYSTAGKVVSIRLLCLSVNRHQWIHSVLSCATREFVNRYRY